jgi:hypothetical protein
MDTDELVLLVALALPFLMLALSLIKGLGFARSFGWFIMGMFASAAWLFIASQVGLVD